MKKQGWSLQEMGYPVPMSDIMFEDLLLLQGFIDKKASDDEKKAKRQMK